MYELKPLSPQSAGRGIERAPGLMMAAQPASTVQWSSRAPDVVSPLFYWRSLWCWKLVLIALTLAGAALGAGAARMRTPTYYAHTILRPVSAPEAASPLSFAGSLLGLNEKNEADAYRYISIIISHQFIFRLIDEHRLTQSGELATKGWLRPRPLTRWDAYRTLKGAMEVQFDRRQGNVVIDLRLQNRRLAEAVLGWMIGDLREQLRRTVLDESEASNRSLEEQARGTPDDIVRQQVYQQIAYGLQRAALAKVKADFAFSVIDPPLADDQPADLGLPLVAALVALAMLVVGTAAVWTYDYLALMKGAESRASGR